MFDDWFDDKEYGDLGWTWCVAWLSLATIGTGLLLWMSIFIPHIWRIYH